MSILSKLNSLKPKNKRSFTLIELVLAIIVLSIVVIPIAILLIQLILGTIQTQTNSVATSLGAQVAERVLWNYSFANLENAISSGSFSGDFADYSYSINVICVDENDLDLVVGSSDYKKVIVTVSHSEINPVVINFLVTNI